MDITAAYARQRIGTVHLSARITAPVAIIQGEVAEAIVKLKAGPVTL